MTRSVLLALSLLALFVLAPFAAGADEGAETWRFRKGDVVRAVDVSAMPDFVREALLDRMRRDGFERVEDRAAHEPGRDLARDAAILARHGGRFPGAAAAAAPDAARGGLIRAAIRGIEALLGAPRSTAVADVARDLVRALRADLAPLLEPALRGLCLGADVVFVPGGEGWRVRDVAPGSQAAALGLAVGDRVLAVDGRAADAEALRSWSDPGGAGTGLAQRTLRIRRREGQIEIWTISAVPAVPSKAPRR